VHDPLDVDHEDSTFFDAADELSVCSSSAYGSDNEEHPPPRHLPPARHTAAAAIVRPAAAPPTPCEPLDSDSSLPPGLELSASRRAQLLVAMRAAVLKPADSAACAAYEDRSPATLERFLRARDYDVAVSAALYLEHRAWRKSLGWHVPASAVPAQVWAHKKVSIQALSRRGAPLLILLARRHTMENRDMTAVRLFIVHSMDRIMDSLAPGGQMICLVDFEGLSRKNADV